MRTGHNPVGLVIRRFHSKLKKKSLLKLRVFNYVNNSSGADISYGYFRLLIQNVKYIFPSLFCYIRVFYPVYYINDQFRYTGSIGVPEYPRIDTSKFYLLDSYRIGPHLALFFNTEILMQIMNCIFYFHQDKKFLKNMKTCLENVFVKICKNRSIPSTTTTGFYTKCNC